MYRKNQQRNDYQELKDRTYKWTKTILGKYIPYNNEAQKIFEFGKKLEEYDYEKLYGDDNYCNKLVMSNYQNYKLILTQTKAIKETNTYKQDIKDILVKLKDFVNIQQEYTDNIKTIYKTDPQKFKVLMLLYGSYMKSINLTMSTIKSLQNLINDNPALDIKNLVKKNKSDQEKEQLKSQLNRINTRLKTTIDKLNNYMKEIEQFKDKIDELL